MDGIGDRLKSRAAELGLSGAEVARRAGLTATRYGHYLQDIREPDLATLIRICRVLALRPDLLLAYDQPGAVPGEEAAKRARIASFVEALDQGGLDLALPVVQAIAATPSLRGPVPERGEAAAAAGHPRAGKAPARGGAPPD